MSDESTSFGTLRRRERFRFSPLHRRRWRNFRANRRAFVSLWIFGLLFAISLGAEYVANERPLLVSYRGELLSPVHGFYRELRFNGEPSGGEAQYRDPVVQCLILTGGDDECVFADDATAYAEAYLADDSNPHRGWILWAPVPWSHDTIDRLPARLPAPPSADHWWGTNGSGHDLVAKVIYGVRLSVTFGLIVTAVSTLIGVFAGAVQGFYGGLIDLIFQRVLEIWTAIPSLFVILIISTIYAPSYWSLVVLITLFSWPALVGVVRAEFLRARNFEYVLAARALGVSDGRIMLRHVLPNALVATVTLLPFLFTGAVATLAGLDFLGYGLPADSASLGEIGLEARGNYRFYWLALVAFFSFTVMLSLAVFVFEGVRDAFDPRKTFAGDLR